MTTTPLSNRPTPAQLAFAALDSESRKELAAILLQEIQQGVDVSVQTFDLSAARSINDPFIIGSFKTVYVAQATDGATQIQFRPNSRDVGQQPIPLNLKDVYRHPLPFYKGFFHWTAQPGKTVTVVMISRGDFTSGSSISALAGGVNLLEGSVIATDAVITVTTVAQKLIPANSSRKVTTLYNTSGQNIYYGDATVTIANGIPIPPGGFLDYKNSSGLYLICPAGTSQVNSFTQT